MSAGHSQHLQLRQVKGHSFGNYRNVVEAKSTEEDDRRRGEDNGRGWGQ